MKIIPPQNTYIHPNYDLDSIPPSNNPAQTTESESSPSTAVIHNIQQNLSPLPSKSSSLSSNIDVFNHDHPHQYNQGFYNGVEQTIYQNRDKIYTAADLNHAEHVAYGQGRHNEFQSTQN